MKWYPSQSNSQQRLIVLTEIKKKMWMKSDGSSPLSVHPPCEPVRIKDSKNPNVILEAIPFIFSKEDVKMFLFLKILNSITTPI